ncbi:UNVERIFIED_CONTAM: hypothetical protein PYX00_002603 [Menopon gallinae]|uniref:Reverse transcriptase domain-containing protein n=1 Tax=Menopon gallinae TaxID=328185 RepID=A0AAW2HXT2_9NEOP
MWNVAFYRILEERLPTSTRMIYHADDTLLITKSFDFVDIAIRTGEVALYRLRNTMQYLRLLLDSRRLYATAVERFVVYGKPVLSEATTRNRNVDGKVAAAQKTVAIKTIWGYRTIGVYCEDSDYCRPDSYEAVSESYLEYMQHIYAASNTATGNRNLYNSTVHNLPGFSDATRLQHLKSIRMGEAVKVISNIAITKPTSREQKKSHWSDAFRKNVFLRLISVMCSSYRQ